MSAKKYYVYKIINNINQKIYIGKTDCINKRLRQHLALAKKGSGFYLHNAMLKYGIDNFSIEKIFESENELEVLNKESYYIDTLKATNSNVGYNLTTGGERQKFIDQIKDKMSKSALKNFQKKEFVLQRFKLATGLTLNNVEEMKEMARGGVTAKEICNHYKLSRECVRGILRGTSWKLIITTPPISAKSEFGAETVYKVRKLISEGMRYDELSKTLKISISTLRQMARGYGSYKKYSDIATVHMKRRYQLTDSDVRSIIAESNLSVKELANKYKVKAHVIYSILGKKCYKHITVS